MDVCGIRAGVTSGRWQYSLSYSRGVASKHIVVYFMSRTCNIRVAAAVAFDFQVRGLEQPSVELLSAGTS